MTTLARRRGRPPLEATGRKSDGRSPELTVSLPASELAELQRIAVARDMSVGAVIRAAVASYLRARAAVAAATAPVPRPLPTGPRLSRSTVRHGI